MDRSVVEKAMALHVQSPVTVANGSPKQGLTSWSDCLRSSKQGCSENSAKQHGWCQVSSLVAVWCSPDSLPLWVLIVDGIEAAMSNLSVVLFPPEDAPDDALRPLASIVAEGPPALVVQRFGAAAGAPGKERTQSRGSPAAFYNPSPLALISIDVQCLALALQLFSHALALAHQADVAGRGPVPKHRRRPALAFAAHQSQERRQKYQVP